MTLTAQLVPRKPSAVPHRRAIVLTMLVLALGGFLFRCGPVQELRAQQVPGAARRPTVADPPKADDGEEGGVFLPSDRTLLRGLATARRRIAQGEYTQAIRFLNDVLGQEEDSFEASGTLTDQSPGPKDGYQQYTGLKETTRRMIRNLPPEGRAAYELAYRAHAQRLLQRAIQSGSIDELARIVRQFFYTPAGYEATLLYAQNETDHGRNLAAALAYGQLLDTPEAVRRFQPQLSILAALSWLATGNRQRAEKILNQLKQQQAQKPRGEQTIRIAGQQLPLFGPGALFDGVPVEGAHQDGFGKPVDWLHQIVGEFGATNHLLERQWLTLHGNEARNGQTEGGLPHLRVRWKVRLLGHPKLATLHDDLMAQIIKNDKPSAVAAAPLAIGNTIITRSANQLLAVDFRTGKLVWAAGASRLQPWEQQLRNAAMDPEGQEEIADPTRSFAQRIWEDRLLGVLSSDGKSVFAIGHLSTPQPSRIQQWQVRGLPAGGGESLNLDLPGTTNRLSAYDLETEGRLVWEVDGQTAKDQLEGAFFLGVPLSIGQTIYSLVEIKSAIYLVGMDGKSGQLQWRQKLASLETSILMDPTRRLQASTPSYNAGILVCPTGAGVVVGVDLAKRSLAWAYRYDNQQRPQRAYHRLLGDSDPGSLNNHEHWIDSSPILAKGRVLLSPPESKFLHCLDLATGKFFWKQSRRHYHTLACVATVPSRQQLEPDGQEAVLLLLSNTQATALRLRDGKPAWNQKVLNFPRSVQPSGTGFQSHGRYYLPLTSAEVIAIDLARGTIDSRASSRDGQVLGNLICHQGTILSQTGRFLDRFDQVEVLQKRATKQLAANPNHAEALRVLGEIAYDRQQLDKAIELLIRAHQLAPDDILTGEVLSACLLTALEEDFATYRDHLNLLWELISSRSSDRLQLLRIHAEGLLSVGELFESLDVCLQIFQEAINPEEMLSIGGRRQVQVARWVQAQTGAIWSVANDAERATLRQRVTAALDTSGLGTPVLPSLAAARTNALQRYLRFFGDLPQNRPWWLQRARVLLEEGKLLAAQQILLRLSPLTGAPGARDGMSDVPEITEDDLRIGNESTALLAQLLHQAGRHRLAMQWDQHLTGPLANVVCLQSQQHGELTGAQCVSRWQFLQNQSGSEPAGLSAARWPYGKVEVTTSVAEPPRHRIHSPLRGVRLDRTDSMLGSGTVLMSSRKGEIIVRNNLGQQFFHSKMQMDGQQAIHYRAPGYTYGVSRGNLLVVSLGAQLLAFNTLASSGDPMPEVLWRSNLIRDIDPARAHSRYRDERSTSDSTRLGSNRALRWSMGGNWVGVIGPVTSKGCVYQDQRRLICCDPLTGQVMWSRTDVPTDCDLFGDSQYVFVSPRTSNTAYVFRMADGSRVDQVTIPLWSHRLTTLGRQVIRWREVTAADKNSHQGKHQELSCVDALSGDMVWKYDFREQSRIDIARGRFVAVVEPSGQCTILDARTGNTLVHDSLRPDPMLSEIHLLVASDRFTLLTNHRPSQQNTNRLRGLIPADCPMITGQVACYDRTTGQPCWNQPADIKQQALMLTQPRDLPILLFVNFFQRRDSNRGSRPSLSMLILEMASGRTLYRADNLPNTGGSHLVVSMPEVQPTTVSPDNITPDKKKTDKNRTGQNTAATNPDTEEPAVDDPAGDNPAGVPGSSPPMKRTSHEIAIEMTARVVRLNFTGTPRPPQPPAMVEVEAESSHGSKGIFGIFQKLGAGS